MPLVTLRPRRAELPDRRHGSLLEDRNLRVLAHQRVAMVLVVLAGIVVLGMYHVLINPFKVEYFQRVTAVGYSCSKLDPFGFLSLPISLAPLVSLVLTWIILPQASFLGPLSGIIVGYAIAWGRSLA